MKYLRCKRKSSTQNNNTGVLTDTPTNLWDLWVNLLPVDDPFLGHETVLPTQTEKRKRAMFTSLDPSLDIQEGDLVVELVIGDDGITYVESTQEWFVGGVNNWSRSVEVLLRENVD
jgi:hypothetical protein